MQIQRIQSLYLVISLLLAIFSLTGNWLRVDPTTAVNIHNDIPLMVLGLLATILPLLAIFLYKNLRRQKLTCRLSLLFAVITLGYTVALAYLGPNPQAEVCIYAPVAMALSGVFDWLAIRGIVSDEKLLKSADRLR